MRRLVLCSFRSLLILSHLPPADLTTALFAEVESRAISIDTGRAAPATAVTARFDGLAPTRTQLLLATTLALKERTAGSTVGTALICSLRCAVCTQRCLVLRCR